MQLHLKQTWINFRSGNTNNRSCIQANLDQLPLRIHKEPVQKFQSILPRFCTQQPGPKTMYRTSWPRPDPVLDFVHSFTLKHDSQQTTAAVPNLILVFRTSILRLHKLQCTCIDLGILYLAHNHSQQNHLQSPSPTATENNSPDLNRSN